MLLRQITISRREEMIKIGIVGITGYAGENLYRLLYNHPHADIRMICARSSQGKPVSSLYNDIKSEQVISPIDYEKLNKTDLVFLAVPHGTAKEIAEHIKVKIIDFTGDHRLTHPYGLPEFFKQEIKTARIIANPGCYATSCLLASLPIKDKIESAVFHSLSGYSGGGRNHQYETKDNVIPYKLTSHRHNLEMERFLGDHFIFTPHVIDTLRGILTTSQIFFKEKQSKEEIIEIFREQYRSSLTKVIEGIPQLRDAVNTPFCYIGGFEQKYPKHISIISAIDNLLKGAASQAIENMNILFGLNPSEGLSGKAES